MVEGADPGRQEDVPAVHEHRQRAVCRCGSVERASAFGQPAAIALHGEVQVYGRGKTQEPDVPLGERLGRTTSWRDVRGAAQWLQRRSLTRNENDIRCAGFLRAWRMSFRRFDIKSSLPMRGHRSAFVCGQTNLDTTCSSAWGGAWEKARRHQGISDPFVIPRNIACTSCRCRTDRGRFGWVPRVWAGGFEFPRRSWRADRGCLWAATVSGKDR